MKHLPTVLAWILTLLLACGFLLSGAVKFIGTSQMVREFADIGFGQWLRYFTGVLEVSGAIGLLLPRYRFLAALQLVCVMVGATSTNLVILHDPSAARLTATLLALALILAWLRRPASAQRKQGAAA